MQQIQLDEQLFQQAQRRAAETGFPSVDQYVADVLKQDLDVESDDFEFVFTPERLAKIDQAVAELDAGKGMTPDEVDAFLNQRRAEWLNKRGS